MDGALPAQARRRIRVLAGADEPPPQFLPVDYDYEAMRESIAEIEDERVESLRWHDLFKRLDHSDCLNYIVVSVRAVRVIDDLETLRVMAEPTRAAIIELLTERRSVTELAKALGVPRTRLYHHIELLTSKGLVEQVDERRVGALTERIYTLTAKTFRPSARLLERGDAQERTEAITTLLFDTTKSDLKRSMLSAQSEDGETRPLGMGRSIAFLTDELAAALVAELEALVARFDQAHEEKADTRPFALVWALYPSSRRIG